MSKKKMRIKITLRSDLCASSGYAFAGIIDSDIEYESHGLPYIPARRIKGCMKESGEAFLHSIMDPARLVKIFGMINADKANGITIDNAFPEDYETMVKELGMLNATLHRKYTGKQDILETFTSIRGQTQLQDGTALKDTLRYTRVLNRYFLGTEQEQVFYAPISFEDDSEGSMEKDIRKLLSATRNIGLKRNRGLGSVRCELVPPETGVSQAGSSVTGGTKAGIWENADNIKDNDECVLTFVIQNDAPLMLSGESNDITEKYINGTSVLGFAAGRYLASGGTADDPAFKDLFLNGITKYTNLYPCKYTEGETPDEAVLFYPAPEYLKKTKKSKELINGFVLQNVGQAELEEKIKNGNQPKKLKNKFIRVRMDNGVPMVEEIEVELRKEYHHTGRRHSLTGNNTDLYALEVIAEGQYFSGQIYTKGKYVQIVETLLEDIRFGKSKTVQYGKCHLVTGKADIYSQKEPISYKQNDYITVTFLSDGAFFDESGYTIYTDNVRKIAAGELTIDYYQANDDGPEEKELYSSMIQTRVLYGYQTKWNMRKEPVPVISAGSCLVFRLKSDAALPTQMFLGEKNQEGCGMVKIDRLYDGDFAEVPKKKDDLDNNENQPLIDVETMENMIIYPGIEKVKKKYALLEGMENMLNEPLQLNSSALGRVILMLKESMDNTQDPQARWLDFNRRVESIKTVKVKTKIQRHLKETVKYDAEGNPSDHLWAEKLMAVYTQKKYENRIQEKNKNVETEDSI